MVFPTGGMHVLYGCGGGGGEGAATGCRAMIEAAVIADRRSWRGGQKGMARMSDSQIGRAGGGSW